MYEYKNGKKWPFFRKKSRNLEKQPFGTEFAQIFQKRRILGGTILRLVPTLIFVYLAVSTERPDLIFQNFLMKINE